MDSENRCRSLAGLTPGAAADMICKRLKGASTDPVTRKENAGGYTFYQCRIPVAIVQACPGAPDAWYINVFNLGPEYTATVAEFLAEWTRTRHPRTLYSFAVHDAKNPILSKTVRKSNDLGKGSVPRMHARFGAALQKGAAICNHLQSLFSARQVVHARFTVKFGSKRKGTPDTMYTTFWLSDKKLYEYHDDIEVADADGNAVDKPTFMQVLEANDAVNAERFMLRVSPLARLKARRGGKSVSINAKSIAESAELRAVFLEAVPNAGRAGRITTPTHVRSSEEKFEAEGALCRLHAFYHDVLSADDVPRRRVRTAPRWAAQAVAKTPAAKDADGAAMRCQAEAEAVERRVKVVRFEDLDDLFAAVKDESISTEADRAEYLVHNGYHVNAPTQPSASMGAFISRMGAAVQDDDAGREDAEAVAGFENATYGRDEDEYYVVLQAEQAAEATATTATTSVYANGYVTIVGEDAMRAISEHIGQEAGEYEMAMIDHEEEMQAYYSLSRLMGDVRMKIRLEWDDEDEDEDEGYRRRSSARIGYVSADSRLGQYLLQKKRSAEESPSSRDIGKLKAAARASKAKAAASGDKPQFYCERDSKGRFVKKSKDANKNGTSTSSSKDAAKNNGRDGQRREKIVKVEAKDDIWSRSKGEGFSRANFATICSKNKLKDVEKAAYKHTEFFKSKGWDVSKNPKITIMVNFIRAKNGTLPEDYESKYGKPQDKPKNGRQRPRGQKRQHRQNSQGRDAAKRSGAPKYNRKSNQTGTPTDALPMAAV